MSLAYAAAEYFVEVLGSSPNFSIGYDYIKTLINQANEDIRAYLKQESKKDILFIFKRFPDVFVFNLNSVSLTDAFLSLYAFPNSANFSAKYNGASAFEISVIEYFKLILSRCGTCPFFQLFDLLRTQNGRELASYFAHYTSTDMYAFFQTHSDTFQVVNDHVYLKRDSSTRVTVHNLGQEASAKCMRKLTKSVYFLLTCFESLHYIELKQCISFVLSCVGQFLNRYSLMKQRAIFENLLETTMDKKGFISLKNFNACMPKSCKSRLMMLIVCILAFEREMHFQKLVREVEQRSIPEVTSSLCRSSITEQFKFFRKFSEYFVIHDHGYVSLLSCFVFPLCCFENQYVNLNQLQKHLTSNFKPTVPCSVAGPLKNGQNFPTASISRTSPQNFTFLNVNRDQNSLSESQNTADKAVDLKLSVDSNILNLRTRHSILFLLQCFDSTICENILKSLLHVLDDVRMNFFSLPSAFQHGFIKECCRFYNVETVKGISKDTSGPSIINKEKTLLFIVYVLIKKCEIHFEKLTKLLISSVVDNSASSLGIADQFKYYKSMDGYLTVSGSGYISLNESFEPVNSSIDSLFVMFSKAPCTSESIAVTNEQFKDGPTTNKVLNPPRNEESIKVHDVCVEDCIDTNKSEISTETSFKPENMLSASLKFSSSIETEMQIIVYKRLAHSVLYLQDYYNPLSAKYVLETFLHSLIDVQSIFYKISSGDQHKFIENYFQFINNESIIEISTSDFQPSNTELNEDEKAILLITYLLIQEKSLHYQYIVKRLIKFEVQFSFFAKKVSNQFKHFKSWNKYFTINGDGYVCLNSSFFTLNSIISSLSAFIPEIQRKYKINIRMKSRPTFSLEKDKMSDVSVENTLQNIVVSVKNGDNKEPQRTASLTNEVVKISSTNTNSNADVIDIIIDACVSILSACEKMQIEKLCHRLNSCNIKSIQNYFSFFTVSEKINFFKSVSLCFDVSKDGFVSLKEGALTSYVAKTNVVPVNHSIRGQFTLESGASNEVLNKPETGSPELSDSFRSNSSTSGEVKVRTRRVRTRSKNKMCSQVSPNKNNSVTLENGKTKLENCLKPLNNHVSKEIQNKFGSKSEFNLTYPATSDDIAFVKASERINEFQMPRQPLENARNIPKQNETSKLSNGTVSDKDSVIRSKNINDLKSHSLGSSTLKFHDLLPNLQPKDPLENARNLAKQNETNKLSKGALSDTYSVIRKKNIDIIKSHSDNSSTLKFRDLLPNLQPNGELNKCSEKAPASVSPKLLDDIEIYSSDGSEIFHSLSPSSPYNDLDSNEAGTNSFESYGTELLNSLLGELTLSDSKTNLSCFDHTINCENSKTMNKHYSYGKESLNSDAITSSSTNIVKASDNNNLLLSATLKSNSEPKYSNSGSSKSVIFSHAEDSVIELRAVNFFCTILGKYDIGVSADFLVRHINLASSEVQNFMLRYFEKDALSFFMKHTKVFYVSPQINNIYLVKKS